MARISKSLQAFQRTIGDLNREAQKTGKNVNKRQIESALKLMTKDGRVSVADHKAAAAVLDDTPLSRGAKEMVKDFVDAGTGKVDGQGDPTERVSPWATRLGGGESSPSTSRPSRAGGGESSSAPSRSGGGEASPAPSRPSRTTSGLSRRGGGESFSTYRPSSNAWSPSRSWGGGE